MMTTSAAISSGQAARYYRHYRKENGKEYYVEGDVEGEWLGAAAATLGLAGPVVSRAFKRVLDGRHPVEHAQLVRGSSAVGGKHVAAWDVTFAAPKSVLLVALIGRDDRVLRAHDAATRVAVAAVEELARARIPGRKRGDLSGNIAAALFRHSTSRDLDPHLHTHAVVVNMTKNAEGKWVALDGSVLFELQRYGTTVYRNALAAALLRTGYDLRHGQHGQLEITGITDDEIAHFSKRHAAIWAALRAEGRTDPEAQKRVQRSTRRRKQHVGRDVLDASWEAARRELGIDFSTVIPPASGAAPEHDDAARADRAREAIDYAIKHVTEREAVTRRTDLVEAALRRRLGYVSREDAERELDRRIARRQVVPNLEHPEYVTTAEMLALERSLLGYLYRTRGTVTPIANEPDLAPYGLTESQRGAAIAILESTDRLVGVAGVAGAGKTFALRAVKAEAERAGYLVRGFAPTTGATEELAKSGIDSMTVAALLTSLGAARDREVWIVGEASRLSTKQLHGLFEHAGTARARVVLVGDPRQHAAVEAGNPFRLLLAAGMNRAELNEIHRQRENALLLSAVTDASRGETASAVEKLDAMGAVTEIRDWEQRHAEIADRYASSTEATLVIAPSNREREELNT